LEQQALLRGNTHGRSIQLSTFPWVRNLARILLAASAGIIGQVKPQHRGREWSVIPIGLGGMGAQLEA
jgi:hypothetical protein